jgi:hypothetical protein
MSRRVWSSSSERTGAGNMRFFACDACVVENCLAVYLVDGARNALKEMETGFIVELGTALSIIAGY